MKLTDTKVSRHLLEGRVPMLILNQPVQSLCDRVELVIFVHVAIVSLLRIETTRFLRYSL